MQDLTPITVMRILSLLPGCQACTSSQSLLNEKNRFYWERILQIGRNENHHSSQWLSTLAANETHLQNFWKIVMLRLYLQTFWHIWSMRAWWKGKLKVVKVWNNRNDTQKHPNKSEETKTIPIHYKTQLFIFCTRSNWDNQLVEVCRKKRQESVNESVRIFNPTEEVK